MHALNLACYRASLVFAFILADFNRPRAECALCTIPACFNTCDRKCINAAKFYRIFSL